MDITESSIQSLVDELRDRMAFMSPLHRAQVMDALMDGYHKVPALIVASEVPKMGLHRTEEIVDDE